MTFKSKKEFYKRLFHVVGITVLFAVLASTYSLRGGFLHSTYGELTYFRYKSQIGYSANNSMLAGIGALFTSSETRAETPGAQTESVPVLLYHGIVPTADRFSLTKERFKDQMFALKSAGYSTISLHDFDAFIAGKKELPEKSFLLTFDDGRRDSYKNADQILRAAGFTAVMFVATADSLKSGYENGYYINKEDIREMVGSGRWEIGSHAVQENGTEGLIKIDKEGTLGNFLSNKEWLDHAGRLETDEEYGIRITRELVDSKMGLEKVVGLPVTAFSYPFSDYGQQTKNYPAAEEVIAQRIEDVYKMAFQQIWPVDNNFTLNYKNEEIFHLRRIESGTAWSGEYLVKIINAAHAKSVPYRDDFSADFGWKKTWGSIGLENKALHLQSITTTSGAFTFLDGTSHWKDYLYTVNAEWEKGTHASLIARFDDSNNYLACTFSDAAIRIDQKVGGQLETVVKVANPVIIPKNNVSLSIVVDGPNTRCFIGSHLVAYAYNHNTSLDAGGIGAEVWDVVKTNASLRIHSMSVLPVEDLPVLKASLPAYSLWPVK